ncbi:class I SAM-dependent methyltransferase [Streptomyces anulatus]
MEPPYLDLIRQSYDAVAADYARTVKDPSELDPLSRAVLGAFAELVTSADLGPTADVGCGPGKVTAYLTGLGVSAFGIDLSPRMVGLARAAHPELRFEVGSMTALETGDGELGGILAFYSTHHLRRRPAGVIGPSCHAAPQGDPPPCPLLRRRAGAVRPVPYAAERSPTGRLRRATSVSEGGVHAPSGG